MLNNRIKIGALLGNIFYWILKHVIARIATLIWLKKITGLENIPKEVPFIIAANHSSHLDFMPLISVFKERLVFFVKDEYYDKIYWRFFLEKMGHLRTGNGSFRKALRILRHNGVIAIFPEGTRTKNGDIGEAEMGTARLSAAGETPIVPVGIKGSFEVWPPQKKFPVRRKIVFLHIGKPIFFLEEKNPDFQERSVLLMRKIEELKNSP